MKKTPIEEICETLTSIYANGTLSTPSSYEREGVIKAIRNAIRKGERQFTKSQPDWDMKVKEKKAKKEQRIKDEEKRMERVKKMRREEEATHKEKRENRINNNLLPLRVIKIDTIIITDDGCGTWEPNDLPWLEMYYDCQERNINHPTANPENPYGNEDYTFRTVWCLKPMYKDKEFPGPVVKEAWERSVR